MIIPRFKYSYHLSDVYNSLASLFKKEILLPSYFNEIFPKAHFYLVSSSRVGIKYTLEAFQLKKGARVGVQPYTCSSVFAAITAAGCIPYFIDINKHLTLSTEDLSIKIREIDALIITHIFGFCADIDKIKEIACHIPVIEDCAHALFSEYQQRQVGTFFDAAVFSFGNGKFPSFGGGGLVVVNRPKIADYISKQLDRLPKPTFMQEIKHVVISYIKAQIHSKPIQFLLNWFRMDTYLANRNKKPIQYDFNELQPYKSTKGQVTCQLMKYKILSRKQNENGLYLAQKLENSFYFLHKPKDFVNYFFFTLLDKNRDQLFDHLKRKNILSGKHFQHALYWALYYDYKHGDCPLFEEYNGQILAIPCYYSLNKTDLDSIAYHLLEFRNSVHS